MGALSEAIQYFAILPARIIRRAATLPRRRVFAEAEVFVDDLEMEAVVQVTRTRVGLGIYARPEFDRRT